MDMTSFVEYFSISSMRGILVLFSDAHAAAKT